MECTSNCRCRAGFVDRIVVTIALIPVLFLLNGCILPGKFVTITIPEIGMCLDYDESTNQPIGVTTQYPADAERIIVYFEARLNFEAEATYRWWYEDSFLGEFTVPLDNGYNFGWLTPQELWPVGNYKVEILSGDMHLRETTFEVVP